MSETTTQTKTPCDIYGCENREAMRTKNVGTGRELGLCGFHGSIYLQFPMERCVKPELLCYVPDEGGNLWRSGMVSMFVPAILKEESA